MPTQTPSTTIITIIGLIGLGSGIKLIYPITNIIISPPPPTRPTTPGRGGSSIPPYMFIRTAKGGIHALFNIAHHNAG